MTRCRVVVHWADTDHTARCVLPENHIGPHTDRVFWFDGLGLRVPRMVVGDRAEQVAREVLAR